MRFLGSSPCSWLSPPRAAATNRQARCRARSRIPIARYSSPATSSNFWKAYDDGGASGATRAVSNRIPRPRVARSRGLHRVAQRDRGEPRIDGPGVPTLLREHSRVHASARERHGDVAGSDSRRLSKDPRHVSAGRVPAGHVPDRSLQHRRNDVTQRDARRTRVLLDHSDRRRSTS